MTPMKTIIIQMKFVGLHSYRTKLKKLWCANYQKKEFSFEGFTLPCTIGNLNITALADLGSRVNIMLTSLFQSLALTNIKGTKLMVEMAHEEV